MLSLATKVPVSSRQIIVPTLLSLLAPCVTAEENQPMTQPEVTDQESSLVVSGARDGDFKTEASTTPTKMELPLQETPQSVVVVPQELIQAQGFFSVRDSLRNVPGLTMGAGENSRTGDRLTIRGFTADNDFYTDGLRDNGQFFRDTFNLQQVEVLKGPSAVLFGRGSTGGVVNSVTKTPSEAWESDASLTGGSYDFHRAQAGTGGPLTDDIGLRFDAFAQENESFRDEQETSRWGAAPTAAIDLTPTSTLTLQYFHQYENSTTDYGIPSFNGKPADVDISNYYGFKDDGFQKYDVDVYTARVETRLSDPWTLRNALRFGDYSRDYRSEPMGAVTFNVGNPADSTVARAQQLWDVDQRNFIGQTELGYKGKIDGRELRTVVGVELAIEHYETRNRAAVGTPSISIFDPVSPASNPARIDNLTSGPVTNNQTNATTVSGYSLISYEFIEHLTAMIGARADRFEVNYRSGVMDFDTGTYTPNAALPAAVEVDNLFSPRAALVWTPIEEASAYVSYGSSYNPSAESYSLTATTATVDPERTDSYEVGVKSDLFDHALAINTAVFHVVKTDQRTPDPIDPLAPNVLDGESHVDGVELGVEGRVTDRLNIFAGAAFLDSEVDESNAVGTPTPTFADPTPLANSVTVEGKELTNTPDFSGNIWATYDLGWDLTWGVGLFYVGERWADTVNSVKLPDYFRVDTGLGWRHRFDDAEWFAQLNVFNVLDETYYDGFGSANRIAPGAPVSGQLTVGARF